jgi:hypothetical protein
MTDLFQNALRMMTAAIRQLVCGVRVPAEAGFHLAHFRRFGGGFAFGGRLLELALGGIVCLTLAAMSHLAVSDWVEQRYASPELSRAAGILTFIVVLGILGMGLMRFL